MKVGINFFPKTQYSFSPHKFKVLVQGKKKEKEKKKKNADQFYVLKLTWNTFCVYILLEKDFNLKRNWGGMKWRISCRGP